MPLELERNIVLIGMPGVGKSTVGVLLAKATSRSFLDTDVTVQAAEGRTLQEILDREGLEGFCRIEEHHLLGLDVTHHVVATGGSAVYSDAAMRALGRSGVVVHLDLPLPEIEQRLSNLTVRGIVMARHRSLAELYAERLPLYRRYSDLTVPVSGLNQDQVVTRIVEGLADLGPEAEQRRN